MKRSAVIPMVVLLFALLYHCAAAQVPPQAASREAPQAATAADAYSKQAYVQEEIKTSIRFESDGTGRRQSYARYKAESEAGVQQLALIRMGYNTAFERITIEYVRVLKSDGQVITVPTDSVQDLPAEIQRVAPLYTDFREKHINVPALRPGDSVEYSVRTDSHTAMIPGQFWTEYTFERGSITLKEQLEIDVPADRGLRLKFGKDSTPQVREEAGRKIYAWSHANLSIPEPRAEVEDETVPDIQLSSFRDWAEVARWYAGLQSRPSATTDAIRAKALQLTKGLTSREEQVQALYTYVSGNIRYLGLLFGMGRFEPHPAGDVLRNMYGDCKDKHTLFAALLAAIDVKAAPVLAGVGRKLDPDVPSPSQFNHLISAVLLGNKTIFADTTTEVAPLGYLVPMLRKKQVLQVEPDGGALVTTVADPPVANMERLTVDGRLDDAGKLEATVTLTANGDAELVYRTMLRRTPEAQWQQLMKELVASSGLSGEVSEVKSTDPSDARKPFQLTLHLTNAKYVDWSTVTKLPLPMLKVGMRPAATPEQKKGPIHIGPPSVVVRELRLEVPRGSFVAPPVKTAWSEDFAEYKATYSLETNVLKARREYRTKLEEIPRARYEAFNKIYEDISKDEDDVASVIRNGDGFPGSRPSAEAAGARTGPQSKAADLFSSARSAWQAGNLERAERDLQSLVKIDDKYPEAWLALARVYSRQGFMGKKMVEKAMEAYRNELSADPKNTTAMQELALLLYNEGRLAEAAELIKRELQISASSPGMDAFLGMLLLYSGQPAEAIAPLERASSGSPAVNPLLAHAYFQTGNVEKGMAAITPDLTTEDVLRKSAAAVVLADANISLDRAEETALAALKVANSKLRGVGFNEAQQDGRTWKLAHIWGALGWVYWKKGDSAKAHKYLEAAWAWASQPAHGDHLAQVLQAEGKQDQANRIWAIALAAATFPQPDVKARFIKAAGSSGRAEDLINAHRLDSQNARTYEFLNARKLNGSAQLLLLIGPGPTITQVELASGDQKLTAYVPNIQALRLNLPIPDGEDIRVMREGIVSCNNLSKNCMLVLTPLSPVMAFKNPSF